MGSEGTPKVVEMTQRKLAQIEDKWERHGALDEGEICFLIRMAFGRCASYWPTDPTSPARSALAPGHEEARRGEG